MLEPEPQRPVNDRHFARTDEILEIFSKAPRIYFAEFRDDLDALANQDASPRG